MRDRRPELGSASSMARRVRCATSASGSTRTSMQRSRPRRRSRATISAAAGSASPVRGPAYEIAPPIDEGMGWWWTAADLRCRPPARGPDDRVAAGGRVRPAHPWQGRSSVRLQHRRRQIRGHIDGVIVGGPEVGLSWPALFEHKALNQKSWTDLVKRGLRQSKPIYFAQCQLYMAYMELEVALLTAMNKNTQELYHEVVRFDPAEAQKLSDKRSTSCAPVEADELPPGSRSRPTSTSAGCAPTPALLGGRHERELHPVRPAGEGDPRDQGLVPAPDRRTAGVPGVRLCR